MLERPPLSKPRAAKHAQSRAEAVHSVRTSAFPPAPRAVRPRAHTQWEPGEGSTPLERSSLSVITVRRGILRRVAFAMRADTRRTQCPGGRRATPRDDDAPRARRARLGKVGADRSAESASKRHDDAPARRATARRERPLLMPRVLREQATVRTPGSTRELCDDALRPWPSRLPSSTMTSPLTAETGPASFALSSAEHGIVL